MNIDGLTSSPAGSAVSAAVYDSTGDPQGIVTRTGTELANLAPDTYFVWITQPSPMTGSMRLTLETIPRLVADGTGVPVHDPTRGQPSYFTFDALAGESVSVALTNISTEPPSTTNFAHLNVFAPGGTSSIDGATCQATRCSVLLRNLAKSGTYRIRVTPYQETATVSATLTLAKAVTGTLSAGQPFALNLGTVGQPALLSFSQASAGPFTMSIGSINSTPAGTGYRAILYNAANAEVASADWSATSLRLTSGNLPAGPYTVWIYSPGTATASMTVSF